MFNYIIFLLFFSFLISLIFIYYLLLSLFSFVSVFFFYHFHTSSVLLCHKLIGCCYLSDWLMPPAFPSILFSFIYLQSSICFQMITRPVCVWCRKTPFFPNTLYITHLYRVFKKFLSFITNYSSFYNILLEEKLRIINN